MLKRMFLMLAVMLIVIAALGFVKFQQILDSQCSGRGVSAASSSGDDHRRGDRVVSQAEFDRAMAEEKQIVSARRPPSYEPSRSTGARIFDANTRDHQERATAVAYTALAGMTSSTSVPAPASLHTATLPSISVARSDMPRNP